jgi:hypothetical protein
VAVHRFKPGWLNGVQFALVQILVELGHLKFGLQVPTNINVSLVDLAGVSHAEVFVAKVDPGAVSRDGHHKLFYLFEVKFLSELDIL